MKLKSFSLLEIIFAISILSIIAVIAIPKIGSSLDKAKMIKIKRDIILIRDGLNNYKNKVILSAQILNLETLDIDNQLLFSKILTNPILASNIPKSGNWEKISNTTYKVWLNSTESLQFTFNKEKFTFDCDKKDNYCKDLS
jgi:general secretion pathway protein G